MRRLISLSLWVIVFALPVIAFARKTDSNQPLLILANNAEILYKQKKTILIGNVSITQGTTRLTGKKVIVYYDQNNKLDKLFAYGSSDSQASYSTVLDKNDKPFHATANTIEYYATQKLAKFITDAHANDGTNTFSGDELEYWLAEEKVHTKAKEDHNIEITIIPESLKDKNSNSNKSTNSHANNS